MQFAAAYITALIVFLLIDAAWLSTMANVLYRPVLGDIVLPGLRVWPAVAFYVMFPIGIVAFAAMPALKSSAVGTAVVYGLLFGAIAYGTYDLTNYATLRNWNLQITVIDIVYGALASAVAGTAATLGARATASWMG
jgi:uncharacterized membrane protein